MEDTTTIDPFSAAAAAAAAAEETSPHTTADNNNTEIKTLHCQIANLTKRNVELQAEVDAAEAAAKAATDRAQIRYTEKLHANRDAERCKIAIDAVEKERLDDQVTTMRCFHGLKQTIARLEKEKEYIQSIATNQDQLLSRERRLVQVHADVQILRDENTRLTATILQLQTDLVAAQANSASTAANNAVSAELQQGISKLSQEKAAFNTYSQQTRAALTNETAFFKQQLAQEEKKRIFLESQLQTQSDELVWYKLQLQQALEKAQQGNHGEKHKGTTFVLEKNVDIESSHKRRRVSLARYKQSYRCPSAGRSLSRSPTIVAPSQECQSSNPTQFNNPITATPRPRIVSSLRRELFQQDKDEISVESTEQPRWASQQSNVSGAPSTTNRRLQQKRRPSQSTLHRELLEKTLNKKYSAQRSDQDQQMQVHSNQRHYLDAQQPMSLQQQMAQQKQMALQQQMSQQQHDVHIGNSQHSQLSGAQALSMGNMPLQSPENAYLETMVAIPQLALSNEQQPTLGSTASQSSTAQMATQLQLPRDFQDSQQNMSFWLGDNDLQVLTPPQALGTMPPMRSSYGEQHNMHTPTPQPHQPHLKIIQSNISAPSINANPLLPHADAQSMGFPKEISIMGDGSLQYPPPTTASAQNTIFIDTIREDDWMSVGPWTPKMGQDMAVATGSCSMPENSANFPGDKIHNSTPSLTQPAYDRIIPNVTSPISCVHCFGNWWEHSCEGQPCTNCIALRLDCKRPKCANFSTCDKGRRCRLVHENDPRYHDATFLDEFDNFGSISRRFRRKADAKVAPSILEKRRDA